MIHNFKITNSNPDLIFKMKSQSGERDLAHSTRACQENRKNKTDRFDCEIEIDRNLRSDNDLATD